MRISNHLATLLAKRSTSRGHPLSSLCAVAVAALLLAVPNPPPRGAVRMLSRANLILYPRVPKAYAGWSIRSLFDINSPKHIRGFLLKGPRPCNFFFIANRPASMTEDRVLTPSSSTRSVGTKSISPLTPDRKAKPKPPLATKRFSFKPQQSPEDVAESIAWRRQQGWKRCKHHRQRCACKTCSPRCQ